MSIIKPDREGNLSLTYDVSVRSHGRIVRHLGTGHNAVLKFSRIANAGIPEAKETENLWGNNYRITISGKALLDFLVKYYPSEVLDGEEIDPEEEYVIDCYDMS